MRSLENSVGVNTDVIADASENEQLYFIKARSVRTYVCQCLIMAGVESIMVPSMSKRNPEKETC